MDREQNISTDVDLDASWQTDPEVAADLDDQAVLEALSADTGALLVQARDERFPDLSLRDLANRLIHVGAQTCTRKATNGLKGSVQHNVNCPKRH